MNQETQNKKERGVAIAAVLILLIGASSWIIVPVPGTSKHFAFMLVEVISVLYVVFSLIKNKKSVVNEKLSNVLNVKSQYEKIIFAWCGAFLLFLVVSTGIHFVQRGFNPNFLNYPRVSFVLFVVYWLMTSGLISKRTKSVAGIAFLTGVNMLEVFWFVWNKDLRSSDVVININIFSCLALLSVPFLIRLTQEKGWISWLSWVNLGIILVLIPYTGSRISFALLVVIVVCEALIWLKRVNKRVYVQLTALVLAAIVCVVAIYQNTAYPAQSSLMRATGIDRIKQIENDDLRFEEVVVNPDPSGEAENSEVQLILVNKSDSIRKELWTSAIQDFLKHPLIGTGDWSYQYELRDGIKTQSPHNLILEMLLSYGLIGTVLYCVILLMMLWRLMACGSTFRKIEVIVYSVIFAGFSFFQPTFVSYLLIVWFILVISLGDIESKEAYA